MKKFCACFLAICLLVCIVPVSAETAVEDMSVAGGCNTLDGQVPFLSTQQSVSNAQAALLYEVNTDTLMFAQNADTQLPPSSLVKILTALIALEKGTMTDVVTVRQEVLSTIAADAMVVDLVADEVLTVKDLLYCMMVGSGNDAAVVLATHIMGSQAAFVDELNRYATELGCTGTSFTNVHGLHDDNQYTTARDAAKILKRALENKTFVEIFGAKTYSVPQTNKSELRALVSQNYLITNEFPDYYDARVTGGRTGVANDRSRCIASVAQVGDMELICVVMGAKSVFEKDGYSIKVHGGFNETKQLLDLGFNGHRAVQILHENQVLYQSAVPGGSSDVTVGAQTAVHSVIPEYIDGNTLIYRYVNEATLTVPVEKGQRVCTLQVWCGNVCIAQTELCAMNRVLPVGSEFDFGEETKESFDFLRVFLYILAAGLVLAALYIIVKSLLRANVIAKARRQSRRNSRNRRRSR